MTTPNTPFSSPLSSQCHPPSDSILPFHIPSLLKRYRSGQSSPPQIIRMVYERIRQYGDPAIWITLASLEDSLKQAESITGQTDLPLYGIPFAIKDNIDWIGAPTTAGCPRYTYFPDHSAPVVERLIAAGAIAIGKTNLDQFATGLVGTRTPYGICRNPFHADYIPGGSSSGSACAVSAGLVSFALGTDTAGSGRVPAAFTNIVGFKPSCGRISTRGLVPAVRTLDCVSIFTLTGEEAAEVLAVAGQFDPLDPFAKPIPVYELPSLNQLRVGVPYPHQLNFFNNSDAETNYATALNVLKDRGATFHEFDFDPFHATALMLYEGAWVAERTAAVGEFINTQSEGETNSIVRSIINGGHGYRAIDAFQDYYRLMEYRRQAQSTWGLVDILALPTTGTIYTVKDIANHPLELNRNLGRYTNFVNLMDLSAVSVPSGFQANGLPTGITFMAQSGYDEALCKLSQEFQQMMNLPVGALHVIPYSPVVS